MKQETFTDIEYSFRKKKTKREEFLEIMDEIIPWNEWVGLTLEVLFIALTAAQLIGTEKRDMPEISDGVYITLSSLGFDGERAGILGIEEDSRVEHSRSLIADITETRKTVSHSSGWVSLDQSIYDIKMPGLADTFTEALIRTAAFSRDPGEYRPLDVPGWGPVRACGMECVAVRGNTVVHLYMLAPTGEGTEEYFRRVLGLLAERMG